MRPKTASNSSSLILNAPFFPAAILTRRGALQGGDVEFLRLKNGIHDTTRFGCVGALQQLRHDGGNHLPGEAELVFEPAALLRVRVAARAQFAPVIIDLLLFVANDLERDGLIESKLRTAVQRDEVRAERVELDGQNAAFGLVVDFKTLFSIARDVADFAVPKNGGIKFGGFFGLIVEPQAGA